MKNAGLYWIRCSLRIVFVGPHSQCMYILHGLIQLRTSPTVHTLFIGVIQPPLVIILPVLTHWTMKDTEPAGPGLRSLILRHNPLWQLTFHRSEISRQGHPWVLFSLPPQRAAFKSLWVYVQSVGCTISDRDWMHLNNMIRKLCNHLKRGKDSLIFVLGNLIQR